jgi:ABC-type sugar transport system ATPase subunit
VPCPSIADGDVELGVRPHELALAAGADRAREVAASSLEATATRVEQLGRETLVEFELAGQPLCAALDGSREVRSGEKLTFRLPPQALHWFERTSGRRLAADAVP